MHAARPVGLALAALLAAGVGACATGHDLAALPEGVSVSVYQTRTDVEKHQLEVSVTNDGAEPFVVTGLRFASPQFTDSVTWADDAATVHPGVTVDLPVLLPAADCTAEDPVPRVEISFELPDGRSGSASLEPADRFDRLPALMIEDCLEAFVAESVTIDTVGMPYAEVIGGRLVGHVDLAVTPTGTPGTVTIDSARGTVLLAIADPATGAVVPSQPIDLSIDESSPSSVITLTVVPGRCDAHAIAEDKRGTVFPLSVTTGNGETGSVYVRSPDEVRLALYDYVREACGPLSGIG